MTQVSFSKDESGHFHLPILLYNKRSGSPILTRGFVDTGSTKCMIPRFFNEQELKLPISERDENVGVADGFKDLDYVIIPKVSIAALKRKRDGVVYVKKTDLEVRNIETWLGDIFIVGMNFLGRFDITFRREGRIIIRR